MKTIMLITKLEMEHMAPMHPWELHRCHTAAMYHTQLQTFTMIDMFITPFMLILVIVMDAEMVPIPILVAIVTHHMVTTMDILLMMGQIQLDHTML